MTAIMPLPTKLFATVKGYRLRHVELVSGARCDAAAGVQRFLTCV